MKKLLFRMNAANASNLEEINRLTGLSMNSLINFALAEFCDRYFSGVSSQKLTQLKSRKSA